MGPIDVLVLVKRGLIITGLCKYRVTKQNKDCYFHETNMDIFLKCLTQQLAR